LTRAPDRQIVALMAGGTGVFISYRRGDAAAHAGRLYDGLVHRFGEPRVFMDVDSIGAGRDFDRAIHDAIAGSGVLLVVVGRAWLADERLQEPHDYVRVEIESALDRGIPVIPVLVDGAGLPRAADLPENLEGFARRQAVEIADATFRADAARLIEQLEAIVEAPAGGDAGAASQRWRGDLREIARAGDAHDGTSMRTSGLSFRADGRALAVLTAPTARVLTVPKLVPQHSVTEKWGIRAVALSPDGVTLAVARADRGVTLWDVRSGKATGTVARDHSVLGLAFRPDGAALVCANSDKTARVWDLPFGRDAAVFAHADIVSAVAFSRDGASLATVGFDGIVCVWDVASRDLLARVDRGADTHHGFAFSPDLLALAVGHGEPEDAGARVLDVTTGAARCELAIGYPFALAFVPDGRGVAASTNDGIGVWDASSGEQRAAGPKPDPEAPSPVPTTLAFPPDGSTLASLGTHWSSPRRGVSRALGKKQSRSELVLLEPAG
jgi:TIR domain-containing protein/WD40 domain-containing protein